MQSGNTKFVWELLNTVPDPEIPVISVVELGVIREVKFENNSYTISITPTYSGCPAVKTFMDDIKSCLLKNSTDETKEKLRKYGIAPPSNTVICPQCNSKNTTLISEFGATACKSLFKCIDCLEPFEFFKCI